MIQLPQSFLNRPIAHRALHDLSQGRAENAPASIAAAIDHRYGIEIDVQLSSDGAAMVFHDYELGRLANAKGYVRGTSSTDLGQVVLTGTTDTVPTLPEVLEQVAGKVPLLIEIKDQDMKMGTNLGPLERATADALQGYKGDVAVMSFNPNAIAEIAPLIPGVPLGLTTDRYIAEDWPYLPPETCEYLRDIPDFERVGASFISHNQAQLDDPAVTRLKAQGVPILCWTVKSKAVEEQARKIADNITFEGYMA